MIGSRVAAETASLEAPALTNKPLSPPTEKECIFAAGFFEGDGSTGIYRRASRSRYQPELWQFNALAGISNSDYQVLQWFKDHWGGHIGGATIRPSPALFLANGKNLFSKTKWQWSVSHRSAHQFLVDITPYLLFKRAIAANVLALATIQMNRKREFRMTGRDPDDYLRQEGLYLRHKELMAKHKARYGQYPKALR